MKHSSKMDFVIPSLKKYSLQKYLHVICQADKFIKFARLWEKLIWQNIPTSLRLRPILGVGAIKAHGRGIRRHNAAGLGLHLDASSWCLETSGRVIVPISNSEIFRVWRGLRGKKPISHCIQGIFELFISLPHYYDYYDSVASTRDFLRFLVHHHCHSRTVDQWYAQELPGCSRRGCLPGNQLCFRVKMETRKHGVASLHLPPLYPLHFEENIRLWILQ